MCLRLLEIHDGGSYFVGLDAFLVNRINLLQIVFQDFGILVALRRIQWLVCFQKDIIAGRAFVFAESQITENPMWQLIAAASSVVSFMNC